ncbi:aminodeoxychorismate synthase component I [Novosphingobium sp. 9]|uniref:aminodeoxychorismate synthase component I n=1 Tax=Novosphingobium sp. 9 TaxID=2025349 RepID=UPI0021B5D96E|nr:aminodeoxychorismate synthase component I [Novosphingobium sp. 9]
MPDPFLLLDDARPDANRTARLYRAPVDVVIAQEGAEVLPAIARLEALSAQGLHVAGMLSYEAGLMLEPRTVPLLEQRAGMAQPLLWFGAFETCETIAPPDVPAWLAAHAGTGRPSIGPLEPQISTGDYARAFAAIQEAIHAGDIYQANLTFPLAGPWNGDPIALYAGLRANAEAGYGALLHDGSDYWLSFSPELFFALSGETITVRPMKGTRPRGRDEAEDAALAAELSASAKDRSENLMILDLLRNDLSRVAQAGSVIAEAPFAIESYPTVHQMVSTVNATMQTGLGAFDALRALFPCGSITGAPKIRAMELIAQTECFARGAYCGTIGFVEPSGDAAFNVAIRTLSLTGNPTSGGRAVLGVGSAVVADSQALPEWRECLVKGGFVRKSAGPEAPARLDLIETMRFTPDEGIALLEGHIARIGASALALGFAFDRHAVRNAIQALCFEADAPSRLRLVLGRTGAYALELSDLPETLPEPLICGVLPLPVDTGDWRLAHKTSDRGFYTAGLAVAREAGAHEALFLRDDGLLTEGTFTTIFVERDGVLLTPPATLGLLPGVLRASLLASGRAVEAELRLDDLTDGFFVGNALRGLLPARLLA